MFFIAHQDKVAEIDFSRCLAEEKSRASSIAYEITSIRNSSSASIPSSDAFELSEVRILTRAEQYVSPPLYQFGNPCDDMEE